MPKTEFYVSAPDEMECTLRVTMPLRKWKELRDQIAEAWPGWEFRAAITDVVRTAEQTFRPSDHSTKEGN